MSAPYACNSCDLERDAPGLHFCPSCGEVTDTYRLPEDDGQVLRVNGSGSYLGVFSQVEAEELAFTALVPHSVHGMAVVDRAA